MNAATGDSDERERRGGDVPGAAEPSRSPRVRLEAAILDAGRGVQMAATGGDDDGRATVLVVAAEPDLRSYVRECLRERPELRLLEAATVAAAVALAAAHPAACLVVDDTERDVLASLPLHRAVLIVDELPRDVPTATHFRLLARPFAARDVVLAVDGMRLQPPPTHGEGRGGGLHE